MNKCHMLVFLAISLFWVQPSGVFADTLVEGYVTSDTVWTKEGSPYIVRSGVIVDSGVTLILEPGTSFELDNDSASFRVSGNMVALGTEDEPVLIYSNSGLYPRITAFGGNISLTHVDVRGLGGFFAFNGSRLTFDHVTINRGFIGVYGASFEARHSRFLDSSYDSILAVFRPQHPSTVVIRDSVISGSGHYGIGADPGTSVDASGNYWGSLTGPYHEGENPGGTGVVISGDVLFEPWLSEDPTVQAPPSCCSSVLFIPGFKASRLYSLDGGGDGSSDSKRLWEPLTDADVRALDLSDFSAGGPLVRAKERDIVDRAYPRLLGPKVYSSFSEDMDMLVSDGLIREWLPAAYDWRLSVSDVVGKGIMSSGFISYGEATSTPYLFQEFLRLARESHTGKVTIVAHSNGGLVAKHLIDYIEGRGYSASVDKIVFVAVPQVGTPQAIGSLLHGFKEGVPVFASAQSIRGVGKSMPGAYGLLPSSGFFRDGDVSLLRFSTSSNLASLVGMRGEYGDSIASPTALARFLIGADGRDFPNYFDLSVPEILDRDILEWEVAIREELDVWTPPASSTLLQIVGTGLDTLSGIEYGEGKKLGQSVLSYEPLLTSAGDGVVVSRSATFIPTDERVSTIEFDLRGSGFGHADILESDEVRASVVHRITFDPSVELTFSRATLFDFRERVSGDSGERTRLFVRSAGLSSRIHDSQGRFTGVSTSTGFVESGIPESQYHEFGEVTYFSFPSVRASGSDSSITLSVFGATSSTSLTVGVDRVVGDEVIASNEYVDVILFQGSVAELEFGAFAFASSGAPAVSIDDDGDGLVDREVGVDGVVSEENIPLDIPDVDPVSVPTSVDRSPRVSQTSRIASSVALGDDVNSSSASEGVIIFDGALEESVRRPALAEAIPLVVFSEAGSQTDETVTVPDSNLAVAYGAFRGSPADWQWFVPAMILVLISFALMFSSCKFPKSK